MKFKLTYKIQKSGYPFVFGYDCGCRSHETDLGDGRKGIGSYVVFHPYCEHVDFDEITGRLVCENTGIGE